MSRSTSLAVVLSIALSNPAAANIRCDGAYQFVNGRPVSTPYCQDEQLAARARARNMPVSGAAIRNDLDLKRKVCVASTDTACAAFTND